MFEPVWNEEEVTRRENGLQRGCDAEQRERAEVRVHRAVDAASGGGGEAAIDSGRNSWRNESECAIRNKQQTHTNTQMRMGDKTTLVPLPVLLVVDGVRIEAREVFGRVGKEQNAFVARGLREQRLGQVVVQRRNGWRQTQPQKARCEQLYRRRTRRK